ncbi:MAG TPA: putative bicarbonate transporter, IctB family [Leptolyngbyaceae cyanobacterium M33_DOE_097]|uniref:Putative bicarbonate transporter, IctB family n=1 Tax=Oscillatoriales cyanobacterium SpSt-418 TaxID=2282169 RepID=A0A7C3PGS5_9CYAN|nr:putative bicarbonate transporter, IctB family [Leptolyngbyaceae cyanobacterium M33_DOE_097]
MDANALWQNLTLVTVPFQQWRGTSLVHRLLNPLRQWRRGSVLMTEWAEVIGAGLAGLVFVLAPFVSNTYTGILLGLCGVYWFLLTISDGEPEGVGSEVARSPLTTPIHMLVLAYWGISALATVASPVRRAAFTGFTKLTLYLLFFALLARVLRSPRIRSWMIGIFLLVALWVSAYGWQQKLYGVKALATWVDPESPLAQTTRVYSYLGNPNLLAGYLLPAVILSAMAFFVWQSKVQKALAVTMVLVNGACFLWTYSRGGMIGIVFSMFALAVLLATWWSVYFPPFWRKWALPVGVGGLAVVILAAMLVVPTLRDRALSIFAGRGDSSNNFRINVWQSVLQMIKARPILGIGPGNNAFNLIYPAYQRTRFSALSAYSIILEVAVETGIIGLTCFLWLLFVTISLGWQQLKRLREQANPQGFWLIGAIASIFGMLGHGLFDTVLYRPEVNTLWWFMIALVAGFYAQQSRNSEPTLM